MKQRMKRKRHFVAKTVGELKEALKTLPDDLLIYTGEPYNCLLLEEYYSKNIGKHIKISEFIDGTSKVNENVMCENIWFKK